MAVIVERPMMATMAKVDQLLMRMALEQLTVIKRVQLVVVTAE